MIMKLMRPVLFTAFLALIVFSAVMYTACNKNKCHNVFCLNEGSCDGGSCVCKVGYEGPRCETLSRNKFIRTYNGYDSCGNFNGHTYQQYPIKLLAMRTDSIELTMHNILNDPDDSAVCTMVASDSFYFEGLNNSTRYYGSGKLRNDSLWLRYYVQHDTSEYDCKYFGIGRH